MSFGCLVYLFVIGHVVLCPTQVFGKKKPVPTEVPMLLPHEILDAVCRAGGYQWGLSMTGFKTSSSIAAFWDHCKSLDEWRNHPALTDPASLGRFIAGVG